MHDETDQLIKEFKKDLKYLKRYDWNSCYDRHFSENVYFKRYWIIAPCNIPYVKLWFDLKLEPTKLHRLFYEIQES